MGVWYTTREAVKRSLDSKSTARDDWQVDRAVEAASRSVEKLCNRSNLYPLIATRYFDWPDENARGTRVYRLRLGKHTLISLTTLVVGGDTIASGYLLRPDHGPPYRRVELDTSGATAGFYSGDTHQRAIAITGLWGENDDSSPAGALAEALETTTETAVDVTNSAVVGVGSLIQCESERMVVTAKSLLDTGQNLGTNLAEDDTAVTVNLGSGAAFNVDEVITIDAERMLLVAIAGNNGTVIRAWDGSALAAHTSPADIYAPRTLTVERGAAGTTAATHLTATALTVWDPPGPIEALCRAEAISQILNENAGYARTVGEGENLREAAGKTLNQTRATAKARYGRNLRSGAV